MGTNGHVRLMRLRAPPPLVVLILFCCSIAMAFGGGNLAKSCSHNEYNHFVFEGYLSIRVENSDTLSLRLFLLKYHDHDHGHCTTGLVQNITCETASRS